MLPPRVASQPAIFWSNLYHLLIFFLQHSKQPSSASEDNDQESDEETGSSKPPMVTTNFADWCASYFAQSVTKVIQLRQMWSCLVEQRPLRVSLLHFFLSWTFECGPGVASPNSSSQPKHVAARCFLGVLFSFCLGDSISRLAQLYCKAVMRARIWRRK